MFYPTALLPSSSQAPAKALHGRPTKESPTARRHRASESTSQQSVLPTHHSQPWPLAHPVGSSKMTRKWKPSYEKLRHGLKTRFEFDDKNFHHFQKPSISIGFFPGAVRCLFLQSLLALDFVQKHCQPSTNATVPQNAQLPESCVLLQVFLNDLRSMFCLALLEAWCFPIQTATQRSEATWIIEKWYQIPNVEETIHLFSILLRYSLPIKTTF